MKKIVLLFSIIFVSNTVLAEHIKILSARYCGQDVLNYFSTNLNLPTNNNQAGTSQRRVSFSVGDDILMGQQLSFGDKLVAMFSKSEATITYQCISDEGAAVVATNTVIAEKGSIAKLICEASENELVPSYCLDPHHHQKRGRKVGAVCGGVIGGGVSAVAASPLIENPKLYGGIVISGTNGGAALGGGVGNEVGKLLDRGSIKYQ